MEALVTLIRGSLAFTMLIAAIVIGNIYPNQLSSQYFVGSLICWFVILGPFRWINNRADDIVTVHNDDHDLDVIRAWCYFFGTVGVSAYGIYLLIGGVLRLS